MDLRGRMMFRFLRRIGGVVRAEVRGLVGKLSYLELRVGFGESYGNVLW